jgi:hypothetical protein
MTPADVRKLVAACAHGDGGTENLHELKTAAKRGVAAIPAVFDAVWAELQTENSSVRCYIGGLKPHHFHPLLM